MASKELINVSEDSNLLPDLEETPPSCKLSQIVVIGDACTLLCLHFLNIAL